MSCQNLSLQKTWGNVKFPGSFAFSKVDSKEEIFSPEILELASREVC